MKRLFYSISLTVLFILIHVKYADAGNLFAVNEGFFNPEGPNPGIRYELFPVDHSKAGFTGSVFQQNNSFVSETVFFDDVDGEDVSDLKFRERFFYGGYLGLQIGNLIISVNVSPNMGYRVTNRLTMGIGGTYQYYRDRGWLRNTDFTTSTHIFGGSTYARFMVYRQFFVHGEFEALNLDPQMRYNPTSGNNIPSGEERFWEYNYFAGGGYRQRLSDRVFLNLMILYNFNGESLVYYQNPIFRFGIDVRM